MTRMDRFGFYLAGPVNEAALLTGGVSSVRCALGHLLSALFGALFIRVGWRIHWFSVGASTRTRLERIGDQCGDPTSRCRQGICDRVGA